MLLLRILLPRILSSTPRSFVSLGSFVYQENALVNRPHSRPSAFLVFKENALVNRLRSFVSLGSSSRLVFPGIPSFPVLFCFLATARVKGERKGSPGVYFNVLKITSLSRNELFFLTALTIKKVLYLLVIRMFASLLNGRVNIQYSTHKR